MGATSNGLEFYNETNMATRVTIAPNGKVGIGETTPDNSYQGLTIKGSDPSLRLKTTSGSGWVWTEYVTSAGVNNFSMGVNQSLPYFGIKAGAGLDGPNFLMLSNGNIGISTQTPLEKLSVTGNIHIVGVGNNLYFDTDGSGRAISQFVSNLYEFNILNARGNSSKFVLGNGSISLGTSTTAMFHINTTTGDIGVGTPSPSYNLDIQCTEAKIQIKSTATGGGTWVMASTYNSWSAGGGKYVITSDGGSAGIKFSINSSGQVGINTYSQSARFEVKAAGDEDLIVGRYSGGSAKLFYVYQSSADGYLELRTGADATVTKLSGYAGTPAYMNTKLTVGGTGTYTASTLSVEVALKVNRTIYNWYQAGTNAWDGYAYLHLKTNMWAGGSPNGNIHYTMSLFSCKLYSYSSPYIREGNIGFHNWSGTHYAIATT